MPAIVIVELANGESYPFANQSMFPLVGLLGIVVAAGLLAASRRTRFLLVAIASAEFLSLAYGSLYRPYNIGAGSAAVFTAIAVLGQIGLCIALAGELDMVRWASLTIALSVRRTESVGTESSAKFMGRP